MFNKINNGSQKHIKYRILPAALAWFMLALGINYFAVLSTDSVMNAGLAGMVYGLTVYSVYNSTNFSTINNFNNIKTVAIDITWGTVLCTFASVLFKLVKGS